MDRQLCNQDFIDSKLDAAFNAETTMPELICNGCRSLFTYNSSATNIRCFRCNSLVSTRAVRNRQQGGHGRCQEGGQAGCPQGPSRRPRHCRSGDHRHRHRKVHFFSNMFHHNLYSYSRCVACLVFSYTYCRTITFVKASCSPELLFHSHRIVVTCQAAK